MRDHGDPRPLWNTEFGLGGALIPDRWRLKPAQIDSAQLEAWRTCVEGNEREQVYDRLDRICAGRGERALASI